MSEEPTVDILSTDYFIAQERWVSFWGDQKMVIPNFQNFLGVNEPTHRAKGVTTVIANFRVRIPAKAARKVQLLCGPHWRTLLKARQVTSAIGLNRGHP